MVTLNSASATVSAYLRDAQTVVEASQSLAGAIVSRDQAEIDHTTRRLSDAVARTAKQPLARQGFSHTGSPSTEAQPPTLEDALTIAAADAIMAQVLFAASKAVGEQYAARGAEPLQAVLRSVDLKSLESSRPTAQMFEGAPRFSSLTREAAIETFKTQADAAIDKLLDESDKAVKKIFNSLAEKGGDLVKAFGEMGKLFEANDGVGVLLRGAWDKLTSALDAIRQIAARVPIKDAVEALTDLVKAFSVRGQLERIFDAPTLHTDIKALDPKASWNTNQLDDQSTEIALLEERFAKLVANIRGVVAVCTVAVPLVAAYFAAGPFALALPAIYALAVVAIVFLGKDFSHSGLLNQGKGISHIIQELK